MKSFFVKNGSTISFIFILISICFSSIANAKSVEVAKDIYSFSMDNEYISMFAITEEGVIVFETMNSRHATEMVKAIKQITNKPIKLAFHSHNHWDHASGGKVLKDAGARTIAHSEADAWMKANKYQDMVPADETWNGNKKSYKLGKTQVDLYYLGMNHGLGMTVFVIPEKKIAYIADIVTPNRVIFSVVPDFNLREWERSLKDVLKLNFEKVVFSHNEKSNPLQAGSKEDISNQLQFIVDLRMGFYSELKKGTNPMLIPKQLKFPKYKNWVGYDDWLEMNLWRILVDEFMGPFPWRPPHAFETTKE